MKKTKMEKGITLIALIITIVVLLILAAVAISSIQNDGILHYAQNAADNWNKAQTNETGIIDEYLGFLENQELNLKKFSTTATINGEKYGAYNPVIPKGFAPINTATSSWDATDLEAEVKKGLVISDGTSEFVWIPVAELNSFARLQDGSDTNYRGVLYNWSSDATGATEYTWTPTGTSNREPANLTSSSYADNAERFTTIEWDSDYYQESFNKMVESIAEYKGFYVGRYEMSLSASGTAQSVAGATSVYNNSDANNWWGLYEKATTYSTSGVISEMIWGCQYDAMMKWMKSNNIDVTSTSPTDTNRGVAASYNSDSNRITGASGSNDILNNIYDILGNSREWTQEANSASCRVRRGGECSDIDYPSYRSGTGFSPTPASGSAGSRLALYVEL